MCYDISFTVNLRVLSDFFPDLVFDEQIEMDFDLAVHVVGHLYGKHPVIYTNREDNKPHIRLMEWGCIPYYTITGYNKLLKDGVSAKEAAESVLAKLKAQRKNMLNARSERILGDDKSYWYKIRNRRCLIPVSGIYEHRAIKGWKNKVPYFVKLRGETMFFIPGLYSVAELPDVDTGEIVKHWTFTLITRPANDLMRKIHNDGENKWRMPLFVPFEKAKRWIAEDLAVQEYQDILDFEMPSDELDAIPVYTIRSPKLRPDNKPKNEYWEWAKLPELGIGDPEDVLL